jgi:molybdopterin/thiamine biosynthesis adenylyltransferase/molybdopterin converting factor small subunit
MTHHSTKEAVMPARVYVPTPFRHLTGGQSKLEVEGSTVAGALDHLEARFPGFRERVLDQAGGILHHVNLYVNETPVEDLGGVEAPLREGDELSIIPAMAGGAAGFTRDQVKRYSRHIILGEVGGKGQRRLLESRVLLVGAGGLGSPAALYLAAAGVGTLGIADFDRVDLSNLQRQLLHGQSDVGRLKVDSAEEAVAEVNPDVRVIKHPERLSSDNVLGIFSQYEVVLDGTDNFSTRYLINDACVLLGKPLVHGSIFRFEGQCTVFAPGRGCYRCLFASPPPPGTVPSCAEAGVLGVLPGIVGSMQAVETIKWLLGIGEPLVNRLVLFDALAMEFREVRIRRNADCPVCGDNPTVRELIDYEQFCGLREPVALERSY